MSVFRVDTGSAEQIRWIQEAVERISFRFEALIPGLEAQVRRDYIPVEFIDLSRWALSGESSAESHEHAHGHFHGPEGHTIERMIEGRKRVLGLAWYAGKVSIDHSLDKALAIEVFAAEGAHMVDFFYMTPEQRQAIFAAYHGGNAAAHDHGWFEETGNNDYWSWVGESFMYGFTRAFSDIPTTGDAFEHRTTDEIAATVRQILNPPQIFVRRLGSSIVHRMKGWHERQIRDDQQVTYPSPTAFESGVRLCKTCNWAGVSV